MFCDILKRYDCKEKQKKKMDFDRKMHVAVEQMKANCC
jgi:hypothetical protein